MKKKSILKLSENKISRRFFTYFCKICTKKQFIYKKNYIHKNQDSIKFARSITTDKNP